MGFKLFNASRFYPGNIWFKRLGYLLLIYSIGLNCFVGTIQNKIINTIEKKTNEIDSSNILIAENKFPKVDLIKIKKGSGKEYVFETFRSAAIGLGYDNVITVDRINEIAEISNKVDEESKKIKHHIGDIKELSHLILKVIKITSNLIWISIIWAMIWLYFDIKKSKTKRFVRNSILLSIPYNILVFYFLSYHLDNGTIFF